MNTQQTAGLSLAEIFKRNLRAHDYLRARGLTPAVVRGHCNGCPVCTEAERLATVQRIVAARQP